MLYNFLGDEEIQAVRMDKGAKEKRSVEGGGEGLKGRRGIYGEITSRDGCFLFF